MDTIRSRDIVWLCVHHDASFLVFRLIEDASLSIAAVELYLGMDTSILSSGDFANYNKQL